MTSRVSGEIGPTFYQGAAQPWQDVGNQATSELSQPRIVITVTNKKGNHNLTGVDTLCVRLQRFIKIEELKNK